jgi:hypothetical protein
MHTITIMKVFHPKTVNNFLKTEAGSEAISHSEIKTSGDFILNEA